MKMIERLGLEFEDKGCLVAMLNWWLMAWDMNPAWKGGHGGGEETAAILAIDPSLVHMEDYMPLEPQDISAGLPTSGVKTVRYQGIDVTVQRHFGSVTPSGWFGPDDPKDATEEWGQEMLQKVGEFITGFINEFDKVPLEERK